MGFTDPGLKRLDAVLHDHVDRGLLPGGVGLVVRGQATHASVAGRLSLDGPEPMRRDSLFRIASMTKPITAVAAMMLVEDGALRLDEPVGRLLPELAAPKVLRTLDGPVEDVVPARRPITIEDLLTYLLGWGIVFDPGLPIQAALAGLPGFGMPDPTCPLTPDEYMRRLREVPLMAQPGERWLYTTGSDILGVAIARAAGQPFDAFLQDRILGPLGMADTAFWIPPDKRARASTGYVNANGRFQLFDAPDGMYAAPPAFPAGDSGLVSTADDFARFARFLMSGLAPDGRRLVSQASLDAMRVNRLTPEQAADGAPILPAGWGWGYGLGVVLGDNPFGFAPGSYSWTGGFGTSWFNDPAQDLTVILMTQRVFDSPDPPAVHKDFWRAAYEALA